MTTPLPLSAKEKLAYFKDNIQTPEDQEEFDASKYYYNREDGSQFPQQAHMHPDPSRTHSHPFAHGYGAIASPPYGVMPGGPRPQVPQAALPRQQSAGSVQMDRLSSPMNAGGAPGSFLQPPSSLGAIGRQTSAPSPMMENQFMQPSLQRTASGGYGNVVGSAPPSTPGPSGAMYQSAMPNLMTPSPAPSQSSEGVQFDASEFPVLSATMSRPGVAQRQQSNEFAIQSEDFPALPGTDRQVTSDERLAPPRQEPREPRSNKFGLLGLLDVIRMSDRDLNTLALGSDLTTFGLNLNSTECLFTTFISPFAENPISKEPRFHIPSCYRMRSPTLKAEHLSKFNLDTLFYIFYALPRDMLQSATALELYKREWRWHTELRAWLVPHPQQDTSAPQNGPQFLIFDANAWEVRMFSGARGNLVAGFASEDDIRIPQVVAPPTTS